jgi:integrase
MTTRHKISSEHVALVGEYEMDLLANGRKGLSTLVGGARAFCAIFSGPEAFAAASLEVQLELRKHHKGFASWLMVTGRMAMPADYLARADLRLGVAGRNFHPELFCLVAEAAAMLGSDRALVNAQLSAFAQVACYFGRSPGDLDSRDVDQAAHALLAAYTHTDRPKGGHRLRTSFVRLRSTLFHCGLVDVSPRLVRSTRTEAREAEWATCGADFAETAKRYVAQIALSLRPSTVSDAERGLRELGLFLAENAPEVIGVADLRRPHIEAYKTWLAARPAFGGGTLDRSTIHGRLTMLRCFFERVAEWGYEDAPLRPLIFHGDLPILDQPLPRFLDDASATKLLRAARADDDPFVRLVVEMLARTGMRRGELMSLEIDAVVQIGSAYWLRVPVGKLRTDRYIPFHPQLKTMLDEWLDRRPPELRSRLVFTDWGRPIPPARVDRALAKVAASAGLGRVTAHQLRHTLATQAINRGMSLEAIAVLLGHKTLAMTMVYARIADRTVAEEYFSVTEKVEALYDKEPKLPADAEGAEMAKLRREMHRRMLGNGYCSRPVEMDCHFESICESCTYFVTTVEFRPTLERQRDDAGAKGQIGRKKVFDGLLDRLSDEAS